MPMYLQDEHKYVPRFLLCFVIMLVQLAWENGMVGVSPSVLGTAASFRVHSTAL